MKARIAFVLLALAVPALAFDLSGVLSWSIPEGEVARVEIGGEVVWPSIPYVTNGLIAMWDGEWNVGLGVHDANAMTWKDLVGDRDWQLGVVRFDNQALVFTSSQTCVTQSWAIGSLTKSISVCGYSASNSYFAFSLGDASRKLFAILPTNNRGFQFANNQASMYQPFNTNWSVACNYLDGSTAEIHSAYYNGQKKSASAGTSDWWASRQDDAIIGWPSYPFIGRLYSIRIYNRRLSDAEIAYNAAIDAVRFGIVQ